jgi:uncharacterized protein YjbJ (UPF0337 family)
MFVRPVRCGAQRAARCIVIQSAFFHCALAWWGCHQREFVMNKDQVKGRAEQAKGKAKEVTGKVVGNKDLEQEGTLQKIGGKVQAEYGDLKEDVKKVIKKK